MTEASQGGLPMTLRAPKLTKTRLYRLMNIADYIPEHGMPFPAYWSTPTDKWLVESGLIERVEHRADRMLTIHLCRITPAGRAALNPEAKS